MADAQEFQVRMARATDEDIKAVREFLDYMEEQAEDFVPDPFGLVQRYNDAAASFERIVSAHEKTRCLQRVHEAGATGLEPAAFGLTVRCSNQTELRPHIRTGHGR